MTRATITTLAACATLLACAAPVCAAAPTEYAYGAAPLQQLDFWRAGASAPAPLIVFVHGGGWMRGDKRRDTGAQNVAHAQAGTPAQVAGVAGAGMRGHLDLNTSLGSPDAPATAVVDTWLRNLLPATR